MNWLRSLSTVLEKGAWIKVDAVNLHDQHRPSTSFTPLSKPAPIEGAAPAKAGDRFRCKLQLEMEATI